MSTLGFLTSLTRESSLVNQCQQNDPAGWSLLLKHGYTDQDQQGYSCWGYERGLHALKHNTFPNRNPRWNTKDLQMQASADE